MNPAPPVTRTRFDDVHLPRAPGRRGSRGAVLHDPLDSAEMLADEGEDEALDAEDGDDERAEEQRPREVVVRDPVDEPVDAERQGGERADGPEHDAGGLDRLRPEAGEHVEGEARQAERRVARGAVAGRVADVDLDDGGPAREHERLRELLAADRAEHRLDRLAAVRVEGAAEVRDVDPGEAAEHPVDEPRGQRAPPGVVARGPPAARDVVAGLDRLDEPRHVLRRVLEVAVHRHDDRAADAGQARVHRGVLAGVPLQAHRPHARVGLVQPLERREGPVGRPVVDVEHLVGAAEGLEGARQPGVQLVERRLLLEERHDDGELGTRVVVEHRPGCARRLGSRHRPTERTPVASGRGLAARRRDRPPRGLAGDAVARLARRRRRGRPGPARDVHPGGDAAGLPAERGRAAAPVGREGALDGPRRARAPPAGRGVLRLALLGRARSGASPAGT